MTETSAGPVSGRPHLALLVWALATVALVVVPISYLPLSTQLSFEGISEDPWTYDLAIILIGFLAAASYLGLRKRVEAPLRGLLGRTTLIAAVMGGSYFFYTDFYSQQLPTDAAISVGDTAPNFELQGLDGQLFRSATLRGSTVLLVFYRGHW